MANGSTKDKLIQARRMLVDYAVDKDTNSETFQILMKMIEQLEQEIASRTEGGMWSPFQ